MKVRPFHVYIISLLLVFAVSGAGFANAWDFSDYQDGTVVHIDSAASNDLDMDTVKIKPVIFPALTVVPYVLPLPLTVVSFHTHVEVVQINPRLNLVRSFPSRASPF